MSNHYVEFEVRLGNDKVTCTKLEDAYLVYDAWCDTVDREEVILVRIDTQEEVVCSNEWAK